MDNQNVLISLLNIKFSTLNVYASNGMTWWVSSVVFCGTILIGAWLYRYQLKEFPHFKLLCSILTLFFLSVSLFGVWVIISIQMLKNEVILLMEALQINPRLAEDFTFFAYQIAYILGTTSFFFILFMWIAIWYSISKNVDTNSV